MKCIVRKGRYISNCLTGDNITYQNSRNLCPARLQGSRSGSCNMDIYKYIKFYQKNGKGLWLTVNGKSMAPFFKDGEKVFVRFEHIKPNLGEIILFFAKEEYVLHRVVKLMSNGFCITKGDANFMPDEVPVNEEGIIGFVDMKSKFTLIISFAAALSYWQAKLFRYEHKTNNNHLGKGARILCSYCRRIYQNIFQHLQMPMHEGERSGRK